MGDHFDILKLVTQIDLEHKTSKSNTNTSAASFYLKYKTHNYRQLEEAFKLQNEFNLNIRPTYQSIERPHRASSSTEGILQRCTNAHANKPDTYPHIRGATINRGILHFTF